MGNVGNFSPKKIEQKKFELNNSEFHYKTNLISREIYIKNAAEDYALIMTINTQAVQGGSQTFLLFTIHFTGQSMKLK